MGLVALCIAGIIASALCVRFVGDWLASGEAPRSADAIVVLAGAPERALYAADLYREGFAPRVLLSRPAPDVHAQLYARFDIPVRPEEETNLRILTGSGVPLERIELFGAGSKSTVEEMEALRKRYSGQPVRLLLVTSPLHLRRAGMIAHDVLGETRLQVAIVATPYEHVPQRWWTDQDAARGVILEVTKTAFYWSGGRYRAHEQQ
jgi:uncharacterized SAM-binding protein YcdF (DUF218 family)